MTQADLTRRIAATIILAGALAAALPGAAAPPPEPHHKVSKCVHECEHRLKHCIRTSHTGPERGQCTRDNHECQNECRGIQP